DDQGRPRVAIVNERFAKRYFRGVDPVGRKFQQGGGDIEIVGVVKDVRDRTLRGGPDTGVYLPVKQAQTSGLNVLVRASAEPSNIVPSLLAIVASVDRRMPVYSVHTLDVQIEAGLSSERILGHLSAMFAALATLIAGIGLYGLMAYSVTRRTREIGIRLSTGAQQRDIGMLFARESLLLVALGVLIGVPLALVSVNVLKTLLFGVTATDPATLLGSVVALLLAGCAATIMPLRRATRVSPMTALRYE
ncbi:MAG: FtsX-like permease family protein, partial [Acidobacteriaceae bacterium]|nr:FtsX-like permease family protein [Acidobacteriaceae bacterium]